MYCHNCGKKNEATNVFCENCGKELYKEPTKDHIKPQSSVGKKIGEELITSGVKVGATAVKKGHSVVFKVGVISSILALVIALANYYFSYMVPTPEGVVQTFMDSNDKGDYKTMFSCFDPKSQELLNVGGNLASSLISSLTGFSFDFDTANTISSALGEYIVTEDQKCHATNFKVESIEGEKLKAFVEQFGTKIKSIGNVLGSKAVVSFEVDNKEHCVSVAQNSAAGNTPQVPADATRIRYRVEVKNYGKSGWKIPGDVKFEFVEAIK